MCGIAGVYHFDPERPVDLQLLVAQADSIAHRGPDDGGVYAERGVGLAHRRLSIIDLKGGFQPMWDEETRIGVVFNGEIYNYRDLREELKSKGPSICTACLLLLCLIAKPERFGWRVTGPAKSRSSITATMSASFLVPN